MGLKPGCRGLASMSTRGVGIVKLAARTWEIVCGKLDGMEKLRNCRRRGVCCSQQRKVGRRVYAYDSDSEGECQSLAKPSKVNNAEELAIVMRLHS